MSQPYRFSENCDVMTNCQLIFDIHKARSRLQVPASSFSGFWPLNFVLEMAENDELSDREGFLSPEKTDQLDRECTPPRLHRKHRVKRRPTHKATCPMNPSRRLVFSSQEDMSPRRTKPTKKRKRMMKRRHKGRSKKQKFENRDLGVSGTWVQCTNRDCTKWRYLSDVTDPSQVPDIWTCEMNSDSSYNSCQLPEQDYASLEFVHSKFTEGSLVWAKMLGFPWWPAMIEEDPDNELCLYPDPITGYVTDYHVIFLDKKVTRCWLRISNVQKYEGGDCPGSMIVKGHDYSQKILAAKDNADRALAMPIEERIKTFGFSATYRGTWGEDAKDTSDENQPRKEPKIKKATKHKKTVPVNREETAEDSLLSHSDMEDILDEAEALLGEVHDIVMEVEEEVQEDLLHEMESDNLSPEERKTGNCADSETAMKKKGRPKAIRNENVSKKKTESERQEKIELKEKQKQAKEEEKRLKKMQKELESERKKKEIQELKEKEKQEKKNKKKEEKMEREEKKRQEKSDQKDREKQEKEKEKREKKEGEKSKKKEKIKEDKKTTEGDGEEKGKSTTGEASLEDEAEKRARKEKKRQEKAERKRLRKEEKHKKREEEKSQQDSSSAGKGKHATTAPSDKETGKVKPSFQKPKKAAFQAPTQKAPAPTLPAASAPETSSVSKDIGALIKEIVRDRDQTPEVCSASGEPVVDTATSVSDGCPKEPSSAVDANQHLNKTMVKPIKPKFSIKTKDGLALAESGKSEQKSANARGCSPGPDFPAHEGDLSGLDDEVSVDIGKILEVNKEQDSKDSVNDGDTLKEDSQSSDPLAFPLSQMTDKQLEPLPKSPSQADAIKINPPMCERDSAAVMPKFLDESTIKQDSVQDPVHPDKVVKKLDEPEIQEYSPDIMDWSEPDECQLVPGQKTVMAAASAVNGNVSDDSDPFEMEE